MDWKLGGVALVALAAMPVYAEDSVIGIKLGQPLDVRECSTMERGSAYSMLNPGPLPCWRNDGLAISRGPLPSDGKATAWVKMGRDQIPDGIDPDRDAIVTLIDGRVEAVKLYTLGVRGQHSVLSQLREKYGTPTTIEESSASTMAGATFDSITAHWLGPSVNVSFFGTLSRITSGAMIVTTPKGRADLEEAARDRERNTPRL